jgi:hypothetical protein
MLASRRTGHAAGTTGRRPSLCNGPERVQRAWLELHLNWDEEVSASLDRDDPERLPFDLEIRPRRKAASNRRGSSSRALRSRSPKSSGRRRRERRGWGTMSQPFLPARRGLRLGYRVCVCEYANGASPHSQARACALTSSNGVGAGLSGAPPFFLQVYHACSGGAHISPCGPSSIRYSACTWPTERSYPLPLWSFAPCRVSTPRARPGSNGIVEEAWTPGAGPSPRMNAANSGSAQDCRHDSRAAVPG